MNNIEIKATRLENGLPSEFVEDMLFMATLPLEQQYGLERMVQIFSQCFLAYDFEMGCLYTLFDSNRPMAYGFVFDGTETDDGAPHLHVLSVFPSRVNQGYGSMLLAEILGREKETGITLECTSVSEGFFTKSGFVARKDELDEKHISMYSGQAKNRTRFKLPQLDQNAFDKYCDTYLNAMSRMKTKGMIKD